MTYFAVSDGEGEGLVAGAAIRRMNQALRLLWYNKGTEVILTGTQSSESLRNGRNQSTSEPNIFVKGRYNDMKSAIILIPSTLKEISPILLQSHKANLVRPFDSYCEDKLEEWAYSKGLRPVAGCWYYNVLSRRSLEAAGMIAASKGFNAVLLGKEELPLRTGNPPGELV